MADIKKLKDVLQIVIELNALQEHPTAKPLDHKYEGLYWRQDEWLRQEYGNPERDKDGNFVNQGAVCGTAMCFAGWTAWVDGYNEVEGQSGWMLNPKTDVKLPSHEIEAYAKRSLGLTNQQMYDLFDGDNELGDLIAVVEEIEKETKQ